MAFDKAAYVRDFEELFESNAWSHMKSEAEDEVEAMKEQLASSDLNIESVYFIKGQIHQLRSLANLEYLFVNENEEEVYDAPISV